MAILADVTNIDVTLGGEVTTYGSSTTAGWKNRIMGQKESECTLTFKAQGDGPDLVEGQTGTLLINYVSASHFLTGTAKVTEVNANVNIETGEPVSYDATIKSTGAWAWTGTGATELIASAITVDFT